MLYGTVFLLGAGKPLGGVILTMSAAHPFGLNASNVHGANLSVDGGRSAI